ncbi:uncharacterized protein BT62DRAFT_923872 [Guyanagaster necrorhizus]|uniref:Uncharacterized protein n=1 Tax=Guyanagaster necrorhizus TaxID=856835 RepID=A0A9P7VHX0_9AGAR|nr:uncharacterized protein BT62DRAFT_923872 [Guyanagaster necrorhizus MCA 3950]KAG7440685.1 hypothetical protein BT62DRAFT_923872 [Guyanagaster necrorhizus MCA 3950]
MRSNSDQKQGILEVKDAKKPIPGCEEVVGDSSEANKFNNKHHKGAITAIINLDGNLAMLMKKKKLLFNLKPPYVKEALNANMEPLECSAELNLNSIKEEILAAMHESYEEISEGEAKQSLADYLKAIDQAPALLQCLLQELAYQMSWWFSVIAEGPLPTDNGNIHTSFTLVKPPMAVLFSMTSEVRAQYALNQGQFDILNDTADHKGQAGPTVFPPALELTMPFKHLNNLNFLLRGLEQPHTDDLHLPSNQLPLLSSPHDDAEFEDQLEDQGGSEMPFIWEHADQTQNHAEEDNNERNSEMRDSLVNWQDLEAHILQMQGHSPGKVIDSAFRDVWLFDGTVQVVECNAICLASKQNQHSTIASKGGQNSTVTILIGLMWWRQDTLKAKDRALWKEMVVDVDKHLRHQGTSNQTWEFLEKVGGGPYHE